MGVTTGRNLMREKEDSDILDALDSLERNVLNMMFFCVSHQYQSVLESFTIRNL